MIKKIEIEGREVEINSSAGWFYIYRSQFGRDILLDLMPVLDGILEAVAEMTEEDANALKGAVGSNGITLKAEVLSEALVKLAGLEVVTVFNIFWAMAKNADPDTPEPLEFINSFDSIPFDVLVPEVGKVLLDSCVSTKKVESLRGVFRTKTEQK